jgi:VacB/RNase II family 3'-5' exoribonuclease
MMKNHSSINSPDLSSIAHQTMIDAGFLPDVPPSVSQELRSIEARKSFSADSAAKDLRALLWSSIDNSTSRDLDQVEYAESRPNDDICLMVGIADVDVLVQKGSAIDDYAGKNGTSVYTGVKTFSMLPEELSTDMTSLVDGADRSSIVMEMVVDKDGAVKSTDVYQASLRNRAKLSYESVGAWLDKNGEIPQRIASVQGMEAQVRLQLEAAKRLHEVRKQNGALELETIESIAVLNNKGQVTDLAVTERNSARDIIENFMIAANVTMAQFLEARGTVSLRRVVRTPEHWDRIVELAQELGETLPAKPDSRSLAGFLERRKIADPLHFPDLSLAIVKLLGPGEYTVQKKDAPSDGHFGLAVRDYTHSTAPNRRYADLVTQRLVKAVLRQAAAPYSETEMSEIAAHCTEREDAARKVERKMRKVAAAAFLKPRIGEEFSAIVTGVTPRGTFARLLNPPVDGRIMRGEEGLRVGDKVRVRLVSTNPQLGFIDFARVKSG